MAGIFLKYAGPLNWNDMPVDSHELVALCAPRPVFISAGTKGDNWVDAKGMFLAGVGAGPVYRLLGKKDLGTAEFPKQETPLIDGEVAFRQHRGGHTTGPNWPTFLIFADRYFRNGDLEGTKASGTLDGTKVRFPAKSIAEGVKATITLLESCHSINDGTIPYTDADLKNAQQGDHVRLVFAKPFKVFDGKVEVSELVFTQPMNTAVFWLRSGEKVGRYTKFEYQKGRAFEA